MLGDGRLPFAVEFDQLCIKPQLRRAETNQLHPKPLAPHQSLEYCPPLDAIIYMRRILR